VNKYTADEEVHGTAEAHLARSVRLESVTATSVIEIGGKYGIC
jgi:hypothetical protein